MRVWRHKPEALFTVSSSISILNVKQGSKQYELLSAALLGYKEAHKVIRFGSLHKRMPWQYAT